MVSIKKIPYPQGHVTNLYPHYYCIQIQHRFPVLSQYIQTDIALQVNVRVIDLLRALHLRRVVREVLVDDKTEVETTAPIETLVGIDCEGEVEDIVRVWESCAHVITKGKLREIFLDAQLCCRDLLLLRSAI
jgi:hypothetical protein